LTCVELLGGLGDADGVDEVLEELPEATVADREELPDVTLADRAELLDWALTRTVENRATANVRENFIVAEKDRFLDSRRMTGKEGLSRVGVTCVRTNDLLSWTK
jgi:hypothetical protein